MKTQTVDNSNGHQTVRKPCVAYIDGKKIRLMPMPIQKIDKPYRLTRSEYMQWKNDQKAKSNIRALIALIFEKVKNWEKGKYDESTLKTK